VADAARLSAAWRHYRHARDAARASDSTALYVHAIGEQSVVLAEVGRTAESVEACLSARRTARAEGRLLQSWLTAALGDSLAADGRPEESLRAFDAAQVLLHGGAPSADDAPYLALDDVHLDRWRGNALARIGHSDAAAVLTSTLARHDAAFSRAEVALRTDLAVTYLAEGLINVARDQVTAATQVADAVGSVRVRRRLCSLTMT
jgi:hypothetical protein